jgi:hypothetical protein
MFPGVALCYANDPDPDLRAVALHALATGEMFPFCDMMQERNLNMFKLNVGELYLFQTLSHYWLGVVEDVDGPGITIRGTEWVADTGRFGEFTSGAKPENLEVEPVKNKGSIIHLNGCHVVTAIPMPGRPGAAA